MLKTEGVVLSEIRFKETSKILNIYTREYGKIPVMARGAYRAKSQLIANTQPFSYNEYLFHKGRNFYYLNQGSMIESFYDIRGLLDRFLYGCFLLELVEKSTPEEEENEKLFLLLVKGLSILSKLNKGFEKFAFAFGLKYISFLGYRPHLDSCVICQRKHGQGIRFSHAEGGIICEECFPVDLKARKMDRSMYKGIREILYTPLDKLDNIVISKETLNKLQALLEEYILHNIDRKQFNSLKLIKSIK